MAVATFRTRASSPLKLIVEPWAWESLLLPGDTAVVTLHGPDPAELEVDEKDSVVIVYGWPGCARCTVAINGVPRSFESYEGEAFD